MKKNLIILSISIASIAILFVCLMLIMNISLYKQGKQLFTDKKQLYLIPEEKTASPSNLVEKNKLEFQNLSISVPWEKVTQNIVSGSQTRWGFENKNIKISLDNEVAETDQNYSGIASEAIAWKPGFVSDKDFKNWQKNKDQPKNDFYLQAIDTIPSQMIWFAPKYNLIDKLIMLSWKANVADVSETEKIYHLQTNEINAYEIISNDKTQGEKVIFFDKNGRRFTMLIRAEQNEIDFIMNSIKINQ